MGQRLVAASKNPHLERTEGGDNLNVFIFVLPKHPKFTILDFRFWIYD
jgi:hypothetical protein